MRNLMNWITRARSAKVTVVRVLPSERPLLSGNKYQRLYKYLEGRYATTVVLTFTEIEDILGFALPAAARTDGKWWTLADPNTAEGVYSDAWTVASRTAVPKLLARTVVFERTSSYAR